MGSWIFIWTLMAEALLLMSVLDYDMEAELPPALTRLLKKLGYGLVRSPSPLIEITKRTFLGTCLKHLSKESSNPTQRTTIDGESAPNKCSQLGQALAPDKQIQPFLEPKANRHSFPRAPVSKGYNCPTHKGGVVGCATFFEHENYEYKLLCRGELYFRPKGTHTFRAGPIIPKEPGQLFLVKLDDTGSNVVAFCFEPKSRALGEVNGYAEFLPVQTSVVSSQEAHGLVYAPGQGCVFDWVYGNRSSAQYAWDYNLRYDVGWMHSSSATEELFDGLLAKRDLPFANSQNSLRHSLKGLDSVANFPALDALGEIQVGVAHVIELTNDTQPTENAPIPSSSTLPALPVPVTPHQPGASTSTNSSATSRSVLRRTCNICGRVLRRPSALIIHLNGHYGIKPFQCSECSYSSTNTTNLQRHQQTRHPGSSSGGN
ncbi:unnamed protein product [Rhizoctonia solani]|uniref:C2H2-type domain-containing protein n=1 Tax=Rhizoctonia solani TaxID=456999 RepID=A0A8H3CSI7_9AGAM|nr:unnamed protein product [Rhizoctonia solani]